VARDLDRATWSGCRRRDLLFLEKDTLIYQKSADDTDCHIDRLSILGMLSAKKQKNPNRAIQGTPVPAGLLSWEMRYFWFLGCCFAYLGLSVSSGYLILGVRI